MNKQLVSGAHMIAAAQADSILSKDLDPHLTIALMSGAIRQALLVALQRRPRPDPDALTETVWNFVASALHLAAPPEQPMPFS